MRRNTSRTRPTEPTEPTETAALRAPTPLWPSRRAWRPLAGFCWQTSSATATATAMATKPPVRAGATPPLDLPGPLRHAWAPQSAPRPAASPRKKPPSGGRCAIWRPWPGTVAEFTWPAPGKAYGRPRPCKPPRKSSRKRPPTEGRRPKPRALAKKGATGPSPRRRGLSWPRPPRGLQLLPPQPPPPGRIAARGGSRFLRELRRPPGGGLDSAKNDPH